MEITRLPPIIFRLIGSNFPPPEIMRLAVLSKNTYTWLFASFEGQYFQKEIISRELDLPYLKQDIQKLDYQCLLNLLQETFKLFRLQLGRFVGFKTS